MKTDKTMLAEKQPIIFQQFSKSIKHGSLAHAYLFEGEVGTGKQMMALWVAKCLLCTQPDEAGNACGTCHNCTRIAINEHPDVIQIVPEGQTIKVDQIREIKDTFTKSGMETKQKVLLITAAEKMTVSAANSLLKFLEEPDGQIVVILLTESKARILPTIQSRCQVLHFLPLSKEALKKDLIGQGISEKNAALLAQLTNSLETATELAQDDWFTEARDTVNQWFTYLSQNDKLGYVYVQKSIIKTFKEKPQQQMLFELLLLKYRDALFEKLNHQNTNEFVAKSQDKKQKSQQELLQGMEEILTSRKKMDSNVAFQNVCEQLAWRLLTKQS